MLPGAATYARGFYASRPRSDPADRAKFKKIVPPLGMPRAFAEHLERFPFPPDWKQVPEYDDIALLHVVLVVPDADAPLVPHRIANAVAILPGAALTLLHRPQDAQTIERLVPQSPSTRCRTLALLRDDTELPELDFWRHFAGAGEDSRVMIVRDGSILLRNTVLEFMPEEYIQGEGVSLHSPLREIERLRGASLAMQPAHHLRAQRLAVTRTHFAIPLAIHRPWLHLRTDQLKELLMCAPPPPTPGCCVPRVWETHRCELIINARPQPWTEWAEADDDEIRGLLEKSGARMDLDDAARERLRAWVRLGTNYRGFFADSGAVVPGAKTAGVMNGSARSEGAGCAEGMWAATLCMATQAKECATEGVELCPLTDSGMCVRRIWIY
jgi:hypothetical protein